MFTRVFAHSYNATLVGGSMVSVSNTDFGAVTLADTLDGNNDGSVAIGDEVFDQTFNETYEVVGTFGTTGVVVRWPAGPLNPNYFFLSDDPIPVAVTLSYNDSSVFAVCFAAGTSIRTAGGRCPVEALSIGDILRTAQGRLVPVRWIGRQTLHRLFAGRRMQPVRIRAGALGGGLPETDLTVTADHGMIVGGHVINAAALINGTTIDWVPMADLPEQVTYYHVETEAHDVILANGAPAETFIDHAGRQAFDNHAEYLALYGAERIVPEMPAIRISSQRLLPATIRSRLGIAPGGIEEPLAETG